MRWWSLLLAVGCGHRDGIDFPETLGLLEANRAPAIDGTASDPWPETIVFASGKTDGRYWAHARAYVHADPSSVYQALQVPAVLVDRREIDAWTVAWDTVPAYDVSLTLQQTVDDVITVHYDTTWVLEVQDASGLGVTALAAQWDKTDGTPFIDLLAGSLVVRQVEAGISEVQMVTWLEAALRDETTLVSYLGDLHTDIVAEVHGEPLPAY